VNCERCSDPEIARLRLVEQNLADILFEPQVDGYPFFRGRADTLDVLCRLNPHIRRQLAAKVAAGGGA
jgi:hypothetical protein